MQSAQSLLDNAPDTGVGAAMAKENRSFWTSVPGILTGIAAVLTAVTGLYIAIWGSARPALTVPTPEKAKSQAERAKDESQRPKDRFILTAVIDDPDGYTYVRSLRSTSGEIVARVNQGEHFYTYVQDGNWWQVKTADGKVGYMHVSRIRIISPG